MLKDMVNGKATAPGGNRASFVNGYFFEVERSYDNGNGKFIIEFYDKNKQGVDVLVKLIMSNINKVWCDVGWGNYFYNVNGTHAEAGDVRWRQSATEFDVAGYTSTNFMEDQINKAGASNPTVTIDGKTYRVVTVDASSYDADALIIIPKWNPPPLK